jgi:hypothetical protein
MFYKIGPAQIQKNFSESSSELFPIVWTFLSYYDVGRKGLTDAFAFDVLLLLLSLFQCKRERRFIDECEFALENCNCRETLLHGNVATMFAPRSKRVRVQI